MIWTNFLTNLLGVILGIMLTFGVNFLWRRREEKRRTKDMLILVRNELINNKEMFKIQEELLKKDGAVYQKILDAKNDLASISADTLKEYHFQIQGIILTPLTVSAWQIFQNSEMIQKMTNKEMVIRLTNCYDWMGKWHEYIAKDYWEKKKRISALALDDDPYRFFDAALKDIETYNFFVSFRSDKEDVWDAFLSTDAAIDYTVMLLDKHGDYRYDMEEKDKEIAAYIEGRISQNKENATSTITTSENPAVRTGGPHVPVPQEM
jgi:hypothetical protein